jgi:hypothetical protein
LTRRRTRRSGLDHERARRRELDRSKAEARLLRPVGRNEVRPSPTANHAESTPALVPATDRADFDPAPGVRVPGQRIACLWCGSPAAVKARGPIPKFCSANCRHRAWEQERASRAGRAAVVAVDRTVATYPNDTRSWVAHLDRLAADLQRGQFDRDLLLAPLDSVHAAIEYRQRPSRRTDPC